MDNLLKRVTLKRIKIILFFKTFSLLLFISVKNILNIFSPVNKDNIIKK